MTRPVDKATWKHGPFTREEMENALDSGRLFVQMGNGRWWRLRRNGKTRTWKRDSARFEMPAKAGLRSHITLDQARLNSEFFRIEEVS